MQCLVCEDCGWAARQRDRIIQLAHEAAEWQAAMEALILVATSGGPTMLARIGVMRALNRKDDH
jgi:hypothetical protein